MTPRGWVHFSAALVALSVGGALLLVRKGTPAHRWMGRTYLAAMLVLNGSALSMYEDSGGGFGIFHYLSLISLISLAAGLAAIRLGRGIRAIMFHGHFMAGSYVGLVGAGTGQAAAALDVNVGIAILCVLVVGTVLAQVRVPGVVARTMAVHSAN